MKTVKLLFLCLMLIISACTTPETQKTTVLDHYSPYSYTPEFLNGQIKSIKEFNYWAIENNGSMIKGDIISHEERDSIKWSYDFTCWYDETGLMNKLTYYIGNKKTGEWDIEYANNLFSKASWIKQDTVRTYHIISNDENNHLSGIKNYNGITDSLSFKYEFVANNDGFITEAKSYNSKDEFKGKYTFLRDEENLTKELRSYDSSDSLKFKYIWTYNDKGFHVSYKKSNANNEILASYTIDYIKYDEMGNWISIIIKKSEDIIILAEREYEYY